MYHDCQYSVVSLLSGELDKELPAMWIFPYFMEPHMKAALPSFKMLDYKVLYLNVYFVKLLLVCFYITGSNSS